MSASILNGQPFTSGAAVTAEGIHTLSVTAADVAGNSQSLTITFTIDKTPPVIQSQLAPPPNARNWHNTDVAVSFTAADALTSIVDVTPDTTLTTEGADQTITASATAAAGNSASLTLTLNIDKTPPH